MCTRKVACVDEGQKSAIKDFELRGYHVHTIPRKPITKLRSKTFMVIEMIRRSSKCDPLATVPVKSKL